MKLTMIYQQLKEEYKNLTEEEKNALLIYKSRLSRIINKLDESNQEIDSIYNLYKELLNNPINSFIKITLFKNISLDTKDSFIESLKQIKKIVEESCFKIELPKKTTVYRVISIKKDETLQDLSRTNLISTSLDINESLKFLIPNKDHNHYLYQIDLEAGSKLAICPYAILYDEQRKRLMLSQRRDQEELILSKENYIFSKTASNNITLSNGEILNIINIKAKPKQQEIKKYPTK